MVLGVDDEHSSRGHDDMVDVPARARDTSVVQDLEPGNRGELARQLFFAGGAHRPGARCLWFDAQGSHDPRGETGPPPVGDRPVPLGDPTFVLGPSGSPGRASVVFVDAVFPPRASTGRAVGRPW